MADNKKHNPEPRIKVTDPAFGGVMKAMYALEEPLRKSSLEPALRELVKTRASQINGCAYCLDMHTKDARAQGEAEQRLYALNAWRETPFYTERERAALEWTEQLTLIAGKDVPDDLYLRVREHFSEEELVLLTLAVVQINGYNRFAISFRPEVGSYQPAHGSTKELMQVHIFRGSGRVFGFTEVATGDNLPSKFAPWNPFKAIELKRDGVPTAGVNTADCLDDIEKYGFHITDAHVRITESVV